MIQFNFFFSFKKVLNLVEDEKTGLVECDLSNENGDFKTHLISNLYSIGNPKEDLCLNIKSTVPVSFIEEEENDKLVKEAFDISKSIHKSLKFN